MDRQLLDIGFGAAGMGIAKSWPFHRSQSEVPHVSEPAEAETGLV
jgi:hypothetical protein